MTAWICTNLDSTQLLQLSKSVLVSSR